MSDELTFSLLIPGVAFDLSALLILEGRVNDALSLLPGARAAIEDGVGWLEVLGELRLGEALLAVDRVDEARMAASHALGLARERGEQGHEAWALRLLGEIAAQPRATVGDMAEGHYRQALALAERLDIRPLVAHCHLGLGHLSQRAKRLSDARQHLTTATTMYREMAMPFWLEKAEAAMAAL
jgi:tetratricopeptide (TPR) repeat protein